MLVFLSYISMNHLASNLCIFQCKGSFKAFLTISTLRSSSLVSMYSLRLLIAKHFAASKMLSPSVDKNEASYKDNIPLVSSERHTLKFPVSSLNALKTSVQVKINIRLSYSVEIIINYMLLIKNLASKSCNTNLQKYQSDVVLEV